MTKKIINKLKGPIFSIITPFKKKEQIDYIALRKHIKFMYIRGARNFYLMVYNSRLGLLDEKEIINLNLFCIKVVKGFNKKNIIICAEPYHCSTRKSIKLINIFSKSGADIVSVIFGEKYYSNEQVFSHFKLIHDNTKAFLMLHQQLLENGISGNPPTRFYPVDLLVKICSLRRFVAMKEDAKNDEYTKRICQKLKHKISIITSGRGKKQWMKAHQYGCQSWLSGASNLDPKLAINFYKNFKNKNTQYVEKHFNYVEDPFFKVVDKFGWHLTIKGFLEYFGHFKRYERRPLKELDRKQYVYLKTQAKKILYNSEKINGEKYFK